MFNFNKGFEAPQPQEDPEAIERKEVRNKIHSSIAEVMELLNDSEGSKHFMNHKDREEFLSKTESLEQKFLRNFEELNIYDDLAISIQELYQHFGLSKKEAESLMTYLHSESGGKDVYATVGLMYVLGEYRNFYMHEEDVYRKKEEVDL